MKKKLALPCFALTALLTACPGVPMPDPTYTLTVNLDGLSSAPVKVTNTTTGTVLFNDTLTSGKTFAGLQANSVFKVEGQAVNGYVTPAAQSVTLSADKSVTVKYDRATITNIGGKVRLSLGTEPYMFADSSATGKILHYFTFDNGATLLDLTTTVKDDLSFDMALPTAAQLESQITPVGELIGTPPSTCTVTKFTISDPAVKVAGLGTPTQRVFEIDAPGLTISQRINLRLQVSESDPTPVDLIYASGPLTIDLLATCDVSGSIFTSTVQLKLGQGWNLAQNSSDQYGAQTFTLKSVTADPATLRLVPSGMSAYSWMN